MTNTQFDLFLESSIKEFGNEYIDYSEDLSKPHIFSYKFEKKMLRLIRSERSFYFPAVKTPLRRLVTAIITIIVLMMATTMSVSAFREKFFGFIARIFNTHTEVQTVSYDNSPSSIEDIYTITVPDGFRLEYADEVNSQQPYISYVYSNNDKYLIYNQYVKSEYNVSVNTENKVAENIIINGCNGFIVDLGNNEYYISWDNGDYVFDITGNIGKNALIEVSQSIQKKK